MKITTKMKANLQESMFTKAEIRTNMITEEPFTFTFSFFQNVIHPQTLTWYIYIFSY